MRRELGILVAVVGAASCSGGSQDAERSVPVTDASLAAAPNDPRTLPAATIPERGTGALAPSLARIVGDKVPRGAGADLADVEDCAQCHADVAGQWRKSAHAFASFNNPVYRVVVEKIRKDRGNKTSQFCGGCHDVALLVDGAMIGAIEPTDLRAHAGITCKT
jgi:hypothetical protein